MGMLATGNKTAGNVIDAAERQRDALALRRQGKTFQEIADELGYAGHQGAYNAVATALRNIPAEERRLMRQLDEQRLDSMIATLWPRIIGGDLLAMDRLIRILARRAKMYGLDVKPDGEDDLAAPAEQMTPEQFAALSAESLIQYMRQQRDQLPLKHQKAPSQP